MKSLLKIVFTLILIQSPITNAATIVIEATGKHTLSERETITQAKRYAYENAIINSIKQMPKYGEILQIMEDGTLTKNTFTHIAASIFNINKASYENKSTNNQITVIATLEISADDQIAKQRIDKLIGDKVTQNKAKNAQKNNTKLSAKIKQQLSDIENPSIPKEDQLKALTATKRMITEQVSNQHQIIHLFDKENILKGIKSRDEIKLEIDEMVQTFQTEIFENIQIKDTNVQKEVLGNYLRIDGDYDFHFTPSNKLKGLNKKLKSLYQIEFSTNNHAKICNKSTSNRWDTQYFMSKAELLMPIAVFIKNGEVSGQAGALMEGYPLKNSPMYKTPSESACLYLLSNKSSMNIAQSIPLNKVTSSTHVGFKMITQTQYRKEEY